VNPRSATGGGTCRGGNRCSRNHHGEPWPVSPLMFQLSCRRQGGHSARGDIPGATRDAGKVCPPLQEGVSSTAENLLRRHPRRVDAPAANDSVLLVTYAVENPATHGPRPPWPPVRTGPCHKRSSAQLLAPPRRDEQAKDVPDRHARGRALVKVDESPCASCSFTRRAVITEDGMPPAPGRSAPAYMPGSPPKSGRRA